MSRHFVMPSILIDGHGMLPISSRLSKPPTTNSTLHIFFNLNFIIKVKSLFCKIKEDKYQDTECSKNEIHDFRLDI